MNLIRQSFGILDSLKQIHSTADQLVFVSSSTDEITTAERLIGLITSLFEKINQLRSLSISGLPYPLNQPNFWTQLSTEIIDYLIISYLESEKPVVFGLLTLFDIVEIKEIIPNNSTGDTARIPYTQYKLHWDQLGSIVKNPSAYLGTLYKWNTSDFDYTRLLQSLERLFLAIGLPARNILPRQKLADKHYPPNYSWENVPEIHELALPLISGTPNDGSGYIELGFLLLPVPPKKESGEADDKRPDGLLISSLASGYDNTVVDLGSSFKLELKGGFDAGDAAGIEIHPGQIRFVTNQPQIDAQASLIGTPASPWILVGDQSSSRIEVGGIRVLIRIYGKVLSSSVSGILDNKDGETLIEIGTGNEPDSPKIAVVIETSNADGFIQKIFGSEPQRFEFNGSIIWSSRTGFHFKGHGGLEMVIPINRTIGAIKVDTLVVGLQPAGNGLDLLVGAVGKVRLGPIIVTVDRMGIKLSLAPVAPNQRPGILGNLDLNFGFKPPDGLGIALDSQGVKGGGFIWRKEGQYAGVIDLDLRGFAVQALAVLDTNQPEVSFIFAIFATFEPAIQLGAGWKITKIGGFIGFNRTLSHKEIATGIQSGVLDSVLFPENVIQNAPGIISNFKRIFPSQNGQYLIGPAVRIAFGTPTLLTGDVAIILEFPSPFQLSLLGKITSQIPKDHPVIQINLGILGAIDFVNQRAGFYGTLYNSKILNFTLSGDMAMSASWGAEKNFIFSMGGFHPRFTPPTNFPPFGAPPLRRLRVSFSNNVNLESYLALTSNTFQIGARVDAQFSGGGATISGFLGFDALIQFSPLYYVVDVAGGFSVKYKGHSLAHIGFAGSLEGPNPNRIKGKAVFSILWWDVTVNVNATFGSEQPPVVSQVDPMPLLVNALEQNESWKADFPEWVNLGVTISESSKVSGKDSLLIHPFGTLKVSQKVVPLNHTLSKFGSADPINHFRFNINGAKIGTDNGSITNTIQEYFAPAQFAKYSKSESLSLKSFDLMDSGIQFKVSTGDPNSVGDVKYGSVTSKDMQYETKLQVKNRPPPQTPIITSPTNIQAQVFELASNSYQTTLKNNKKLLYRMRNQPYLISVSESKFVIVDQDLRTLDIISDDGNRPFIQFVGEFGNPYFQATAVNKLRDLKALLGRDNPELYKRYKDSLRVAPVLEVVMP